MRPLTGNGPGTPPAASPKRKAPAPLTPEEWERKQAERRKKWREDGRERYRRNRQHRVYEMTFGDGMKYVGVTAQPIKKRLLAHRRDCSVVGRRLDLGEEFSLKTWEYEDRAAAEEAERKRIARLPKKRKLNILTPLEDWKRQREGTAHGRPG